jgi:hypothetical protein
MTAPTLHCGKAVPGTMAAVTGCLGQGNNGGDRYEIGYDTHYCCIHRG